MNDIAQVNLTEPPKVDWENYGKSAYQVPPDALDAAGKPIVYYGVVEKATEDDPDEGLAGEPLLQFLLDPIRITGDGPGKDYVIRFTRASVRPYSIVINGERVAKKGNPNALADYLRAAGLTAKPQTNDQYRASVNQAVALKKQFGFTIDWEAYNRDTGERVRGFNAFPIDTTTGKRKAVLHSGDMINVLDTKGNPTGQVDTVKSEVLFANARLRYFRDQRSK